MRYFSMFSGIGGFEVGIEKACNVDRSTHGRSQENTQVEEGQGLCPPSGKRISTEEGRISERTSIKSYEGSLCIGYSEIDRYASAIYRRHFPEHRNFGDATKLIVSELPDFDLLVGGFPCQAFSIAGKRAGFMDARGTLFFEIARVLGHKRPRYFPLENVEGLLSHDDRKTFVAIIKVLTDIGYRVQWQLRNTKDYGLPQNRERIFIAGCVRDRSRFKVFPIAEGDGVYPEQHGQDSVANYLDSTYHKGWRDKGQRTMLNVATKSHIRRLTPTECERLQGFPDGWTEYGIDESGKQIRISDTQRYKCLGNAVSTNVIERIIRKWFYEN